MSFDMGKIHKNSFPSINYTQHEIFWNKTFRISVKSCYEYSVLILTLKKRLKKLDAFGIFCIYQMPPLWNSFHCICCRIKDQLLFVNVYWFWWVIIRSQKLGWSEEKKGITNKSKKKKVALHLTLTWIL